MLQTKSKESKATSKKPKLFDEDDSDAEHDFEGNFEIKKQFEGKKGEKLRRLQDRFQGDSRFKIDSRFLEDDTDGNDNEGAPQKQNKHTSSEKIGDNIETNESDERQWQLNILESVIGKKVQKTASKEAQKK